jgi:hypothetical protein
MAHTAVAALVVTVFTLGPACGRDESASSPLATAGDRADPLNVVLETLRTAFEAGDPGPILATFADDVQLHSPALMSSDYRGRHVVASIVRPAVQVLEDVRVTDVVGAGDGVTGGLVFDARVGDLPAQGFVLLRTSGEREPFEGGHGSRGEPGIAEKAGATFLAIRISPGSIGTIPPPRTPSRAPTPFGPRYPHLLGTPRPAGRTRRRPRSGREDARAKRAS